MLALASPRRDLTVAEEAAALRGQIVLAGRIPLRTETSWRSTIVRKLGYATCSGDHPFGWWLDTSRLADFFVEAIRELRPNTVIARSLFLHLVPDIRRVFSGRLVIDCHDADEFLARELIRTVPLLQRAGPWANWRGVRRVALRHLATVDEVWAVSAVDQQRISELVSRAPVTVVPSGMAPLPSPAPRLGHAPRVLMVANFAYGPNANGADWLLRAVWPIVIAARPDARLILAGRGAVGLTRRAALPPGVDLMDPAPDLLRLYNDAAVVVAPIHHGSGTRLKIVDGCRHGKAILTTTKGVEGLDVVRHAVAIADGPDDFARATIELLANPFARHRLAAAALAAFDRHLSLAAVASTLGVHWHLTGDGGAACA